MSLPMRNALDFQQTWSTFKDWLLRLYDHVESVETAATAVLDINDRHYGASITDPVNRPSGAAMQAGDEYFNTTSNLLKRYSGVNWQASDISTANLAASGGAALVGCGPEGVGTQPRTVQEKLSEILSLADKGGIADYVGTPLYDGFDAGRITATDNTAAFNNLVNTAIARGHSAVKIPAGHWAIKTGNLSFANFDRLRIFGDGIGVTILDFVNEDATRAAYVNNSTALCMASFTIGKALEFADLTIKATTKAGIVNGTTGPANATAIYFGAVWGFKINNVVDVRFTRVRAEHFNYRGFSVYGSATERVTIMHCEGFYNVGSGFWCEAASLVKVIGGEFAYNGIFGNPGTGYGVTAAAGVLKFIVDGVYCHHNFRKGIDSHGCGQLTIKNGTYENNVLYHFANPNWVPPLNIVDGLAFVKNNTFSNGYLPVDEAWLKSCYQALVANGFSIMTGCVFQIADTDSMGAVTSNIKSIVVDGNTLICHYNGGSDAGMTQASSPISIIAQAGALVVKNNRWNFNKTTFPIGSNVYSHVLMELNTPSIKWVDNDLSFLAATAYTNATSGLPDYAAVMSLSTGAAAQVLELHDSRWDINDAYFITGTGAGVRTAIPWAAVGAKRTAIGNTWAFLDDRFKGVNGLSDIYFLGGDSTSYTRLINRNNTIIRNGVRYAMPEPALNRTSGAITWASTASKLAGADLFSIVLDKQHHTTIRISTEDGTPDLVIGVPYSAYTGITSTTTNALLSYSSIDANFSEDGLTKLKITIKAKIDLSGDHWGRITIDGALPSLGIERVILL